MSKRIAKWTIVLIVMLAISSMTTVFAKVEPIREKPDLGDAPTSTNSYGVEMAAYPGVAAQFPTVHQAGLEAGAPGPLHVNDVVAFTLGEFVSGERDADIGFDEDPINNLFVSETTQVPDLDVYDDGLITPLNLPHCQLTQIQYTVTVYELIEEKAYVNLWADWDRNGVWADNADMLCADGSVAAEWIVENQLVSFPNPGTYLLTTPPFLAWNPSPSDSKWLRISVSEQSAPVGYELMGSGPEDGYEYGETEDYLIADGVVITSPERGSRRQ